MSAVAPGKFFGRRLVVFGAGYVGAGVAREALARGMRVTALTRNPEKARALAAAGVDAVVGELADDAWHARVAGGDRVAGGGAARDAECGGAGGDTGRGVDFVLNCVSAGGGGQEGYRKSYVDGMRSIAAWAAKLRGGTAGGNAAGGGAADGGAAGKNTAGGNGIGAFVYTSSTAVYPHTGGAVADEDAPCDARANVGGSGERAPGGDARARLLLEAERLALAMHADGTARAVTVLRLAGIYGPGRHQLLDQLRDGADELPGRGDYYMNLVHRDDAAAAIWAAFSHATARNIFNIADDSAATRGEICAWLARQLGRAAPRFSGVAAGGRSAALLNRLIASHRAKHRLGWRLRYPTFREGYAPLLSRAPGAP